MRHDFGVGVGDELVTRFLQALADRFIVLDDAVVHQGDVARHVRMRIALGRRTVRCPARVGDAGVPADVLRARLRSELGDPPGCTHPL